MCFSIKRATKLYFTQFSDVVIISFIASLGESVFSTYCFGKLVFAFSEFSACLAFRFRLHKQYNFSLIMACIDVRYPVALFSFYKKQSVKANRYTGKTRPRTLGRPRIV